MKFNLREYTSRGPDDVRSDEDLAVDHGYSENWRHDPNRPRPLGYGYRLSATGHMPELPNMKSKRGQEIIYAIAADAIFAAHFYPLRRVSYSRGKEWWLARRRYTDGWTCEHVVAAVDALVAAGFLVEHDKREYGVRGTQSSYLPSFHLTMYDIPTLAEARKEVIILKDKAGQRVDYKDSQRVAASRKIVEKVNARLAAARIELRCDKYETIGSYMRKKGSHVFPAGTALQRIFSGGWMLGGRFYAAFWQQVSSGDRQHIYIDDQVTEEVDYSQIHPRILYAWEGVELTTDAYTIEGWDRDLCKVALAVILNAPSLASAIGSLRKKFKTEKFEKFGVTPPMAEPLIEAMKAKHPRIAKYFHSGIGLRLQHLDASMCEIVLREMTVKRKIVCLPVHDSFIVPQQHAELLVQVMKDAYEKVVGKTEKQDAIVKSKSLTKKIATATSPSAISTEYVENSPHSTFLSLPSLLPSLLSPPSLPALEIPNSESAGFVNTESSSALEDKPAVPTSEYLARLPKRPEWLDRKQTPVEAEITARELAKRERMDRQSQNLARVL